MRSKKILAPVAAALVIAFLVILLRGIFAADSAAARFSILSDGFYMAGVLLMSSFLLRLINREGTFDMVVYNLKLLLPLPGKKYSDHLKKDCYTYMEEKREQRRSRDMGFPTLVVGILCILVAWAFLTLYRRAV